MEKRNDDHMIYVKDLFFAVLSGWRAILAAALILGLLLGGIQLVSGMSGVTSAPQVTEEVQDSYEKDKAGLEQEITRIQTELDSYRDYVDNAPLLQLNPYDYYEIRLRLFIQTDYKIQPGMSYQDPDQTSNLLNAYTVALQSNDSLEAMAQVLDTEARYLPEVMLIERSGSTLTLTVKLAAKEAAESLLPILVAQATGAKAAVEATVAKHNLTVTEQAVLAKADASVAELQIGHKAHLTSIEEALAAAQNSLAVFTSSNSLTPVSKKDIAKEAVVYGVVGAVLGAFLVAGTICVLHICSDKIYAARNLTGRTGVKILGMIGCKKENPIDRMLYRLEGRAEPGLGNSPVPADIHHRARDAKHLLITGSGSTADRQALTEAIIQAMPGVLVEDKGCILRDAAALEALAACDTVVLVESCSASRYTNVEKELSVIHDYGTALLGCVLLER